VRATWAPVAHTPVVEECFNWKKLSVIAAITNRAGLLFEIVAGAFCAARVLCFLVDLLRELPGPLILLWDNVSIHRAREVRDFLARPDVRARLEVVWLPPYAPELNATEWVFSAVKYVDMANFSPKTAAQLQRKACDSFRARAQNKQFIRSCILGCKLPFTEKELVN